MKKKETHDEQEVSALLEQLQKSFAEPEKPKKKKTDDVDDLKFQEKLAAMLGKLTQQPAKKSKPRKTTRPTDEPVVDEPVVDEPVVDEPVVNEPVVDEPVVDEPVVDEPIVDEPVVDKLVVDEPVVDKLVVDEPVVDEPVVNEPVVDESAVDEPVVDEPVKEEAPASEKARAKKKSSAKRIPKPKKAEPTPPEEFVTEANAPTQEEQNELPKEDAREIVSETASEVIYESNPKIVEENIQEDNDKTPARDASSHPLDRGIPLSPVVIDDTEDAEATETEEPISVQKEDSVPTEPRTTVTHAAISQKKAATQRERKPQVNVAPQRITITPPQSNTAPAKEPMHPTSENAVKPNRPVVIKPKNDLKATVAPVRQNDSNTIVIRPRTSTAQPTEPIVIQPPTAKKDVPTPQLQTPKAEAAPIKIGKENKAQIAPEPQRDPQTLKKTIMNKKPNTTFVPSTAFPKKPDDESAAALNTKTEQQSAPTVKAIKTPTATVTDTSKSVKTKKNVPMQKKQTSETSSVSAASPKNSGTATKKTNRHHTKKGTSKKTVEDPQLSAMDLVRQRCGLSEDDVAMIFELGYENELGRLVGYENLRQLKNEHLRRVGQTEHKHYRTAYGYRGEEYASTSQRDAVIAAYLHDRKSLIARVLLTALCTLLLLFLELPHPEITNAYMPLVFRLLSLLLLGGCTALSYHRIYAGLHSFFKFTPTPYSVPALLVPFSLLYSLVTVFWGQTPFRVGFLTALVLLLTGICDLLRFSTEMRALKIVSTDEPKIALAAAQPRKKKLRVGDKTVKIINDDIDENRYQVRTTMHTVGHFRRFNNMRAASRPFATFIITAFALSTLAAFVCAIATSNVSFAISDFMTVLLLTAPVSAVFSYFYPLYLANRLLATRGCALIGDEAVTEYAGNKTVIFRDTDLYTAQKSTEIAVRSGDALKRDMTLAGALFRKLGGTIGQMAQALPISENSDLPVSVTRIHENGVEAIVDNRYQLLLGSAPFLTHAGVKVPKETTDSILRRTSNAGLVYVAIDGSLRLSYEIEYQAHKPFERLIHHLAEADCITAISSYDPNLDEVFLQKSRPNAYGTVTVLNPGRYEEDKPAEFTDTGAVAQKSNTDIAYPLFAAYAIAKTRHFAWRIQMIASLLGTLLVTLITLFGNDTMLSLFAVMGIQLFWITVVCLATHSELNADKLHFRKKKK